jgi:phage terminase Nu1 subunit (DNA packaging protein)
MNDKFYISRPAAAYLLNCDVRSLSTYQTRDIDPLPVAEKGKRGQSHRYDPQALMRWKLRQALAKVTNDDSPLNLEQERARLASAQADKAEMDNSVKRGEHAPVELLKFAISDFSSQGASIIEGLPKKIKNSMPSLRAREMKILGKEISGLRNALASIQIRFNTDNN